MLDLKWKMSDNVFFIKKKKNLKDLFGNVHFLSLPTIFKSILK